MPLNPRLRAHADHLRRSAFVRNVMVVMTGTAAAQAIGFALSPVISRLYTPSDFGVFGSFGAVSGVIAAGVTLEYTQAIMLPKSREDAINLFVVSCVSTLTFAGLCLLCCLLAPAAVHGLMNTSGVWVLVLLVVATLVNGLNQACQAWCVRVKAFKDTSASQVVRSLSSNGTQVGLGYLGGGALGLIAASLLGDGLASLNLVRVLLPDLKALRDAIRWARMKQLAREYRDFPQVLGRLERPERIVSRPAGAAVDALFRDRGGRRVCVRRAHYRDAHGFCHASPSAGAVPEGLRDPQRGGETSASLPEDHSRDVCCGARALTSVGDVGARDLRVGVWRRMAYGW